MPEPGQSEVQGCRSVADGHPMAATDEGGKSLLQLTDILAPARNPARKKCIKGKAELGAEKIGARQRHEPPALVDDDLHDPTRPVENWVKPCAAIGFLNR
jgi:hypothetical protein